MTTNTLTEYEILLEQAREEGLEVKEKPLEFNDGRIKGNQVLIRSTIPTETQKACVLAEELGHHYTAAGDILDQSLTVNRKQELRGRAWAYDRLIGLTGIVRAYKRGCRNRFEVADYLGVTEELLQAALKRYKEKYGPYTRIDEEHLLYFEPLGIMELK